MPNDRNMPKSLKRDDDRITQEGGENGPVKNQPRHAPVAAGWPRRNTARFALAVAREQELLQAHDAIVMYWYSSLTGMNYLPPHVVQGVFDMSDERLAQAAAGVVQLVQRF